MYVGLHFTNIAAAIELSQTKATYRYIELVRDARNSSVQAEAHPFTQGVGILEVLGQLPLD
jgi:hypothetical protein